MGKGIRTLSGAPPTGGPFNSGMGPLLEAGFCKVKTSALLAPIAPLPLPPHLVFSIALMGQGAPRPQGAQLASQGLPPAPLMATPHMAWIHT